MLDKTFASQRNDLNIKDLGFSGGNPFIKSYKSLKNLHSLHLKYKFCAFIGHTKRWPIRNDKPFKISEPKTIWVSKKI